MVQLAKPAQPNQYEGHDQQDDTDYLQPEDDEDQGPNQVNREETFLLKCEEMKPLTECGKRTESGTAPSAVDRLSTRMVTGVEKLRDSFPYPCKALPKNFLPTWRDMRLMNKLPSVPVPPNTIVWTRGQIAESLFEKTPDFSTRDPLNMYRVPASEYNALHDPHTLAYFEKQSVVQQLTSAGLIDEHQQVLCSLQEMNRFRIYLASLQNEQISANLEENHKRWLYERDQINQVSRFVRQVEACKKSGAAKHEIARDRHQQMMQQKIMRFREKQTADQARYMEMLRERRKRCIHQRIINIRKACASAAKVKENETNQQEKRMQTLENMFSKQQSVQENIRRYFCRQKKAQEERLQEWIAAKYQAQLAGRSRNAAIQAYTSSQLAERALKRQARMERMQKNVALAIQKRKEHERKIQALVKKLFYKWLRTVRARRSKNPDHLHQSLWNIDQVLEDTMKHLRKESGYETFENFMDNVLKMKNELKRQLEQGSGENAAAAEE